MRVSDVITRPPVALERRHRPSLKLLSWTLDSDKIGQVAAALSALNIVGGLTITGLRAHVGARAEIEYYKGTPYSTRLQDRTKLEMVVSSDDIEATTEQIARSIDETGIEDANIFVFDVKQAMRIRTGEKGSSAI